MSHQTVCLDNGVVSITRSKVPHGDLILFQKDEARNHKEEIRSFLLTVVAGTILFACLPLTSHLFHYPSC